jgi:hypothetical protein
MAEESPEEQAQAEAAAREAAAIGGEVSGQEGLDPAELAVRQGGGGEAEGFEEAEELLIEHASHGDQQSAHAILHDAGIAEEADPERADGEADEERSSEREDEDSR